MSLELQAIEKARHLLQADKVTTRKEGIKECSKLLDSTTILTALDLKTSALHAQDKIPVESWPGLAALIIRNNGAEIRKKKAVDVNAFKLFRRLVAVAQDESRSGSSTLLSWRAAKLFAHVREVLAVSGLSTVIGAEYAAVLRTHLLSTPSYCESAKPEDAQGLLDIVMSQLESRSTTGAALDRSEDSFRLVSTLQMLLSAFSSMLSPEFRSDTVEFFCGLAGTLDSVWDDTRLMAAVYGAINSFLLGSGLDVSYKAAQLHECLRATVCRCWKSSKLRLREALHLYTSIQLRLDKLEDGAVVELDDLIAGDMHRMHELGDPTAAGSGDQLSRTQHALLSLRALSQFRRHRGRAPPGLVSDIGSICTDQAEDTGPPPKRQKLSGSQRASQVLQGGPEQAVAVAALLWREHGAHMPPAAWDFWAAAAEAAAAALSRARRHGSRCQVWVLRLLHQVAAQVPVARPQQQAHGQWRKTWQDVFTSVKLELAESGSDLDANVLLLLTTLVERGLVPASGTFRPVAERLMVRQPDPHGQMLALLAAVAERDMAALDDVDLRQRVLRYSLRSPPEDTSWTDFAVLFAGLLGLPRISTRPDDELPQPRLWCSDAVMNDKDIQLQALLRGEDLALEQLAGGSAPAHVQKERQMPPAAQVRLLSAARSELDTAIHSRMPPASASLEDDHQLPWSLAPLGHTCSAYAACAAVIAAGADAAVAAQSWSPADISSGILGKALQDVSTLWSEQLPGKAALPHGGLLTALGLALASYAEQRGEHGFSSYITDLLTGLESAFVHAASAEESAPSPGMQATDGAVMDDFDMDLDVRDGSTIVSRPAQQSGNTLRLEIAAMLRAFSGAAPQSVAQVALTCLSTSREMGIAPPEELELALVDVVCMAVAAGAADSVADAARLLDSAQGLLATHSSRPQALLTVLRGLQHLFSAAARPADALLMVLEESLEWLDHITNSGGTTAWRWQTRVAAALAVMAAVDGAHVQLPEQLLHKGSQLVCALLSNEAYQARVQGARIVPSLLQARVQVQGHWHDAKAELCLANNQAALDAAREPFMETSILALGHIASACPHLEAECIVMIATHVARQPLQMSLARSVLDQCARRLGYLDSVAYARVFALSTASAWFNGGCSLQELLSVQVLFTAEPDSDHSSEAFLRLYSPFLVSVLMLEQQQDELAAIASAMGVDLGQLLLRNLDQIFGVAYPLTVSEHHADQQLARKTLHGGIIKRAFSEDELNTLYNDRLTNIIGKMLLMASPESEDVLTRPFYTIDTIVHSVHKLLEGYTEQAIWAEVLFPDVVAGLLLLVHSHMSSAIHPRHAVRALAPLQALLQLLGSHVCEPATFRYAVHIVLQAMDNLQAQVVCCSLLSSMFSQLYSQPQALELCSGHVLPVLARISECLDMSAPGSPAHDGDTRAALLRLLRQLTLDAPPALHAALAESEPLPPGEDLKDVQDHLHTLQKGHALSKQLLRFAARAASLPLSLRQRSMMRLIEVLHQQPDALFPPASSSGPAVAKLQPASQQAVDAIWKLVRLSSELQDVQMAALAGELLALLGPLHPSAIAFHPHALARPVLRTQPAEEQRPATASSSAKRSQTPEHRAEPWLGAALTQLHGFLTVADVAAIRMAQNVLRRLLAGKEGQSALAQLDKALRTDLGIYAHGDDEPADEAPAVQDKSDALRSPTLLSMDSGSYEQWVCRFADALAMYATSPALRACRKLAARQASFAELLLPHLLWDLAAHDEDHTLCRRISRQVSDHILSHSLPDPQAVRLLLRCLNHLRGRQLVALERAKPPADGMEDPTLWRKVYWLDLDYLQVARAAVQVSASFSALLYVEYWSEQHAGDAHAAASRSWLQTTVEPVSKLLLEIYETIEEPDGIYAVARSHQAEMQAALFGHEGSWSRALTLADSLSSNTGGRRSMEWLASTTGALQQLGCHHLIRSYCQGLPADARQDVKEVQDECAWRLGEWDPDGDVTPQLGTGAMDLSKGQSTPAFHGAVRSCLEALNSGQHDRWSTILTSARTAIVQSLGMLSTESTANVSPALAKLQMLQTLNDAWLLRWPDGDQSAAGTNSSQSFVRQPVVPDDAAIDQLQASCQRREAVTGQGGHYQLQEPMLALRQSLLSVLQRPDAVPAALADAAHAARKASQLHHAMGAVYHLQQRVQTLESHDKQHVRQEEAIGWQLECAKLLWAQGQSGIAVGTARALLAEARTALGPTCSAVARISTLLGSWLAESRSDSPQAILDMLQSAVSAADNTAADAKMAGRAHFRLARYADALYQNVQHQKQTPEWHTAQAFIGTKRQQLATLEAEFSRRDRAGLVKWGENGFPEDHDSRRLKGNINNLQKVLLHDEQESDLLTARENAFLRQAISNYGRCLVIDTAHDLEVVYRLVQLWLSLGAEAPTVRLLRTAFKATPSHKFLPLMYQMASRLSAATKGPLVSSGFQASLKELLLRMALDHPYHSLYHLYALANGNRDALGRRMQGQGESSGGMERTIDQDKVAAAQDILNSTRASKLRKETVAQIGEMIDLYIDLAAAPAAQQKDSMTMPGGIRRRVRPLPRVPVTTAPLEVDVTCAYEGLPHFVQFAGNIKFVGGINKPKLVQAVDSAGNTYRQLVKSGNDDMRQDAVMQQFFGLVNSLLARCESTARRGLQMITYKVVPFTPAAGLLAWVENTIPLNDFLVGEDRQSGAHLRYKRPGDYSFVQCWQKMQRTGKDSKTPLRERFDDVCAHFKPVMHHFFQERFRDPATWFERRLTYTRSVAVSSIAGYLIGLGDRHSHNILIDQRSADVVHIDLGIAFEQGRFLNTPELIPFRLTRDIVDGFGIAGVEGVMRRCCEETMRVLRDNREALLILIEVFIHDPLYKWAMTPMMAQQRQRAQDDVEAGAAANAGAVAAASGGADLANADAERAVVRVKQKLQGLEGGDGEARAVEGQVQQLLTDAQDPDKLCVTFAGWAPWL